MKILWYKMDYHYDVLEERVLVGKSVRSTAKHLAFITKGKLSIDNKSVYDGLFTWHFQILEYEKNT